MAGNNLEYRLIEDIAVAQIYAKAEVPDRKRAQEFRSLARGTIFYQGDHEFAAQLNESADRADSDAVAASDMAQQVFEERVSSRLRSCTRTALDVAHTDTPNRQLVMPTVGENSSIINNTALGIFSDVLRLGKLEPIRMKLPPDETNHVFIATSRRQSSTLEVEVLEGTRKQATNLRSHKGSYAIYVQKKP